MVTLIPIRQEVLSLPFQSINQTHLLLSTSSRPPFSLTRPTSIAQVLSASVWDPIQVIPQTELTYQSHDITSLLNEIPNSDTETTFWPFHIWLSHPILCNPLLSPYSLCSCDTYALSVSQTGWAFPHLSLLYILFFLPGVLEPSLSFY